MGFVPEQYCQIVWQLSSFASSSTFDPYDAFSDADGERFRRMALRINVSYLMPSPMIYRVHVQVSNSAAILRHEQLQSDVIRSGIMLYGSSPDYPTIHSRLGFATRHASLRSELIAIQQLKAGDSVGYGQSSFAETTCVWYCGMWLCRWLSTDYRNRYAYFSRWTTVAWSDVSAWTCWQSIYLTFQMPKSAVKWCCGVHRNRVLYLSIDEVAAGSGTIGYELMCAVTARTVNFIQD